MIWQVLATGLLIGFAAIIVSRRFWAMIAGNPDKSACGTCGGCSGTNPQKNANVTALVQLGVPRIEIQ